MRRQVPPRMPRKLALPAKDKELIEIKRPDFKDKFSSRNVNYSVEASSPGAKIGNLNWDNIERVGFEFASRANSTSEINVDSLKAFRSEEYADDWLVKSPVLTVPPAP